MTHPRTLHALEEGSLQYYLIGLNQLSLSPPQESKPPPDMSEVVRVPVDEEGPEIEALEDRQPISLGRLSRGGVVCLRNCEQRR